MTFAATILTLYPEMFPGPLGAATEQEEVFAANMASMSDSFDKLDAFPAEG